MADINGVEIFAAGRWNGDVYTVADLDTMIANFDKVGFKPPVKLGHEEKSGDRAFGWITAIYRKGEKLLANLTAVPDALVKLIKDKAYDCVSSEVFWDLERNGKKFRRALKAVALLGAETPGVSDLAPLSRSLTIDGAFRTYQFKKEEIDMSFIDQNRLLGVRFNKRVSEIAMTHRISESEAARLFAQSEEYRELGRRSVKLGREKDAAIAKDLRDAYASYTETSEAIHSAAEGFMAQNADLSYSQAVKLALHHSPELLAAWNPGAALLNRYSPSGREHAAQRETVKTALHGRSDQIAHERTLALMAEDASLTYSAAAHRVMSNPALAKEYASDVMAGRY